MKKMITVILLTACLLASCADADIGAENSKTSIDTASVETIVEESSVSQPESSPSEPESSSAQSPQEESSRETTAPESGTNPCVGDNIFTYALDISDNIFAPAKIKFGMTMANVLEILDLTEADINTSLGEDNPRVIRTISVTGLSDQVMEIISFASDQAAVVEYMIAVDEADYEAACQLLGEQSAAAIPEELLLSAENGVSSGQNTLWEDAEKNTFSISFPETGDSQPRVISMTLGVVKPDMLEYQQ